PAQARVSPPLDWQPEGDREGAAMSFDPPRRSRKLRVFASIAALFAVLGVVGWGAGLNLQSVYLAQVSTWFRDGAVTVVSNLDTLHKQVIAAVEDLASTSASQETISSDEVRDKINNA